MHCSLCSQVMAIGYQHESACFPAPYVDNYILCGPKRSHAFNSAGFKHNNQVQQQVVQNFTPPETISGGQKSKIFLGEGVCGEHEAYSTGSDFRHAPDLTVRPQPKSKSLRKKEIKRIREKKVTVTQGGTLTHDLANALPCSNQLCQQRCQTFKTSFWKRYSCESPISILQKKAIAVSSIRWYQFPVAHSIIDNIVHVLYYP